MKPEQLKQRLDAIDQETIRQGRSDVASLWILEKYGMWQKGRAVMQAYPDLSTEPRKGGRGVCEVSFARIAKETHRSDHSIAKWVALYLAHPDEADFLAWANDEAAKVVARWERKLLSGPCTTPPLPAHKFRILYADPPWDYRDDQDTPKLGGAVKHYPPMSIEELCALPVQNICADNAVLFLWVTSPLLYEAEVLIPAWGFMYQTSFVWDKVKHNMGHYNSVRHELLLVCTRGSCTPDVPTLFDSVITVERTDRHSEKPQEFRDMIDTLYPHGKRIELFARMKHNNWEGWGNEIVD